MLTARGCRSAGAARHDASAPRRPGAGRGRGPDAGSTASSSPRRCRRISRWRRWSGSSTPPSPSGHGDQRRVGDDHDPRVRVARCSPRPSPRSPGSSSRTTCIQEGDVVEKIQTQMQSGKNIYDGWINDSDLIGTHFRYKQAVNLTDWMAGEGKDVTIPTLDVDDFIGKSLHAPRPTASSTSCPTSSSRTSTGSATTGSPAPTSRRSSRRSTATSSACRSTGRPMRTSPSSSPTT